MISLTHPNAQLLLIVPKFEHNTSSRLSMVYNIFRSTKNEPEAYQTLCKEVLCPENKTLLHLLRGYCPLCLIPYEPWLAPPPQAGHTPIRVTDTKRMT
ncbi:hypothetical protein DSUL_60059 [Desulfovibrionales bacterium]